MDRLALAIAVGVALWVFLMSSWPQGSGQQTQALDDERLAAVEAALARLAAADSPHARDDRPRLVGATPPRAPRLDALEARVAALERARVAPSPRPGLQRAATPPATPEHAGARIESLAGARELLTLDDGQAADMKRVIEDTETQLRALYETPNADGALLRDVASIALTSPDADGPSLLERIVAARRQRTRFKQGAVPGRSETYAQAEARIRSEAKREARRILTEPQRSAWDASDPERLFRVPLDVRGGLRASQPVRPSR